MIRQKRKRFFLGKYLCTGNLGTTINSGSNYSQPNLTSPAETPKLPIANMSSTTAAPRWAAIARDTNETSIQLALNLDGGAFPPETDARLLENDAVGHASQSSKSQTISVNTGIGFLDHMLHALAKHAGWSLALVCKGDLHSESPRTHPTSPLGTVTRPIGLS